MSWFSVFKNQFGSFWQQRKIVTGIFFARFLRFDQKFNWKQNIDSPRRSLISRSCAFKSLCGVPADGVKRAYFGILQSNLIYDLVAWSGYIHADDILF